MCVYYFGTVGTYRYLVPTVLPTCIRNPPKQVAYFAPPSQRAIIDLFNGLLLADGGAGLAANLEWDATDPSMRGVFLGLTLYSLPSPLRQKIGLD